jgi:hypothetical protein
LTQSELLLILTLDKMIRAGQKNIQQSTPSALSIQEKRVEEGRRRRGRREGKGKGKGKRGSRLLGHHLGNVWGRGGVCGRNLAGSNATALPASLLTLFPSRLRVS